MNPFRRIVPLALAFWIVAFGPREFSVVSAAQEAPAVSFSIGSGVSAQDEDDVREGVRLAQDYLAQELSAEARGPVAVNVRDGISPVNPRIIGFSGGEFLVIYTGSEGWEASPPFARIQVVVHEYVHVVTAKLLTGANPPRPTWLDEGAAEYLGYRAVADRGLVATWDVDAYNGAMLGSGPEVPALADLESLPEFQASSAPVYSLAYFAVRWLADEAGPDSIAAYYEALAAGSDWPDAFASAFGHDVESFYHIFAGWQDEMVATRITPRAFRPIRPSAEPSSVGIVGVPDVIAAGEQATFLAIAEPSAGCLWTLETADGSAIDQRRTFADGTGSLFWLATVPPDVLPGTAVVAVDCGAGARRSIVAVA
jgi:hypothetical protein